MMCKKMFFLICVVLLGLTSIAMAVDEWSDISYIEGRYSRIYFDYVVSGNTGTFYCINDWMVNQDDGGVDGGLHSNEYNRFNFSIDPDDYELRVYPDGHGEFEVNGVLVADPNSACCWTTSPNMPTTNHTIWEFSFEIPNIQTSVMGFGGHDPAGPMIVVSSNPPAPPAIVSSGPSSAPHVIDGRFTDYPSVCMLPPVPLRDYQEPVRDPFFDRYDGGVGWTFDLDTVNGGMKVRTTGAPNCSISVFKDDIKWSQPPVEVDDGIINGWDEVSIVDSSSSCWNCPTQSHGDADCDGYVGTSDLDIFVAANGTSHGDPGYNPCADFDRDGDVDTTDQSIMVAYWDTNPPGDSPLARAIVADDWICLDERPIKDIHWWGSFKGWAECAPPNDAPSAFHLGIWTDVPDPNVNDSNTFSHPDKLVWEKISNSAVWSCAGYDLDPRGIDTDDACFKFDVLLSQNEWFYQKDNDPNGTVYWLSISAIYDGNTPTHPWGWTTRPHFYNDDAVRIADVNSGLWPPSIDAVWASGEPIEYPAGTSWDMSFTLTTNKKIVEKEHWTGGGGPGDLNDNGVVDLVDFAIFAADWLEMAGPWPVPTP